MSSITTQQTKLDLELVPKEKRLDIRNATEDSILERFKESPHFKFKINKKKRFKLTLEFFKDIFKIFPRVQGQDFDVLPTDKKIVSFLRDLGHTGKSIHSRMLLLIRCINPRERLLHSFTEVYLKRQLVLTSFVTLEHKSFEMKKTKAYKTYLRFATGATPPKKAQKFEKPASPKLSIALVRSVVIRENLKIPVSKKKEKVDVARGKEIELLSDVALTEEAQYEEVRKKSLRDFHKTHPSGSVTATKPTPSTAIIKPSVTNKGPGVKLSANSLAEATHQLSSGNISSLAVAKYTSSGNSFALTVANNTSSGNFF
nr:hypothetical protein [Tanacetum cinerariifolium]